MRIAILGKLQELIRRSGADRTIQRALWGKIWSVAAGPVGVLMAAKFLTPVEQGYLYAFAALQGLQIFFELGLAFIIMQFASHEKGHLEWNEAGTLSGDPHAKERLASLLRLSTKWYAALTLLLGIILPFLGLWFFSSSDDGIVSWKTPWILISLTTAFSLLMVPATGILEGCGKLGEIYGNNLIQTVVSTLIFWVALAAGAGLYAPCLQWLVSTAIFVYWVRRHFTPFFADLWKQKITAGNNISWRREMWPLQWRVSLSWASGYFLFQLATPLIFKSLGPVAAGQFGMTQKLVTAIQNVAHTWLSTKAATFGSLRAQGDSGQIKSIFRQSLNMSAGIAVLLGAAFLAVLWVLPLAGYSNLAERFLTPAVSFWMVLNAVIYVPVYAIAMLARSAKQEPFVWCSLVAAAVTMAVWWSAGPRFGVAGFIAGTLAVNALLVLPWALKIMRSLPVTTGPQPS